MKEQFDPGKPDDLRSRGLIVFNHHDIIENGSRKTIWIMAYPFGPTYCVKGSTDAECLNYIRKRAAEDGL